jgi:hypothetical protein
LINLQTLGHQDYTSNRGEVEMSISIRSFISIGEAQLWCADQGLPDPSISTPATKLGSAKERLRLAKTGGGVIEVPCQHSENLP